MTSTATQTLQITVNGQVCPAAHLKTVADLVAELSLDARKVAIERNLAIVPRGDYATTPIVAGDAIEIVGFIGGG